MTDPRVSSLPLRRRISMRLTLSVLVLLVLVELTGLGLGLGWARGRVEEIARRQTRALGSAVASASVEPVLMRDHLLLEESLRLVLPKQPHVASARFLNAKGDVLATVLGAELEPGEPSAIERVPVELVGPSGERESIGTFELTYAPLRAGAELSTLLLRGTVYTAVSAFVMALLVGLLIGRLLLRPLAQLLAIVHEGEESEFGSAAAARTDELGQLARAVIAMQGELGSQVRLAEAASQAKTEFLTNMSHEIRTPMAAILGYGAELANPEINEDDRALSVARLRVNGEHLLELVNSLLDLAKVEAGHVQIDPVPLDPTALVHAVLASLIGRARDQGLELTAEVDPAVPRWVSGDPLRLRQVLLNLVGNAIKFTESGHVRVLAGVQTGPAGARLRIDVQDTGLGIPAAALGRVFESFEQVDASTTRRFGGTGLGLALARSFVEAHGGTLTATSELGAGSCFTMLLPLVEVPQETRGGVAPDAVEARVVEEPPAALPGGSRRPAKPATLPLAGCTVLVVDDGEDNRRLAGLYLKRAGAELELAVDGREALECVAARLCTGAEFDLILMDMQMPVLDGYLATAELRSREYRGPILALTAHAMLEDRQRILAAGCNDVLTKPIHGARLIEECARHVAAAPSRTTHRPPNA